MTPRERAYQLRDALRAREIALDVTAVDAVEAAFLADRAERDAVRESACAAYERDHANHLDGWAACILADDERDALDARAIARDMRADAARIRARATSPEPEPCVAPGHPRRSASAPCSWCRDAGASPAPAPLAAERAVIEAAEAWRACLSAKRATGSVLCPPGKSCGAALESAVDALAAARQDGAR